MRKILASEEEMQALGFDPKVLACKCCGVVRVDLGLLQRMRALLDLYEPLGVFVTSCCRCWSHNKAVGGAPGSKHLITLEDGTEMASTAMDVTAENGVLRNLDLALNNRWHGGYHYYNRGEQGVSSIHIDTDTRKRRW